MTLKMGKIDVMIQSHLVRTKKYLNITMDLNYYACAPHGILNSNNYVYYLTEDLLVSKVIGNSQVTYNIYN